MIPAFLGRFSVTCSQMPPNQYSALCGAGREKHENNQSRPGSLMSRSLGSSPAGLLSWAYDSVLSLCIEFGGVLVLHTRVANSRGQGQQLPASLPQLPARTPNSAATVMTLTEHLRCAGHSSKCSRGLPSLNVLNTAQRQTLYM